MEIFQEQLVKSYDVSLLRKNIRKALQSEKEETIIKVWNLYNDHVNPLRKLNNVIKGGNDPEKQKCIDGGELGQGAFGIVIAGGILNEDTCLATKVFDFNPVNYDIIHKSYVDEKTTNKYIREQVPSILPYTLLMDNESDEDLELTVNQNKTLLSKGISQYGTIAYKTFLNLKTLKEEKKDFTYNSILQFIEISKLFLDSFVHTDIKPNNVMFTEDNFYIIDISSSEVTEGYGYIVPNMYVEMGVDVPEQILETMRQIDLEDDEHVSHNFAIFAVLLTACQMTTDKTCHKKIWKMVNPIKDKGIEWNNQVIGAGPTRYLNVVALAMALSVVIASSLVGSVVS